MSGSQKELWSNNPNAPKISHYLYVGEKSDFAGNLIGSILYGVLIALFFQFMAALFDSANRRGEGIKWGLVSYTVAMFSFATVLTGMQLNIRSISYIDNREFPGVEGVLPPGPLGYQSFIWSGTLTLTPYLMFALNNWLADGLLLYRCCVFYSMNLWVIAFPCLVFLGSLAAGIMMLVYQGARSNGVVWDCIPSIPTIPYFSISLSLNVLLTLMIVIRLVLHNRNIRAIMGAPVGISGFHRTIITMLIESCALYAVSSLLVVGKSTSRIAYLFMPILSEVQVIAPLLIIKRVANRSALTGSIVVTGTVGSLKFRSGEGSVGGGPLPSESSTSSAESWRNDSGEFGVGVGATIDLHLDSKV